MNGQTRVYQVPPYAEEGSLGSTAYVNPIEVIPGVRAAGTVYAGRWVWKADDLGSIEERVVEQFGANTGSNLAGLLGLCYRNITAALPVTAGASLGYTEGQPIPVASGSAFWVKTKTQATVGQKVFAVLADGTTKTGAAGATISGAIELGWKVVKLMNTGAIDDLILIEKI